jgi:hypothetical protein
VPDRERPDDVDSLAEPEIRGDEVLRHLVGYDRRERDRREREPLCARGRE